VDGVVQRRGALRHDGDDQDLREDRGEEDAARAEAQVGERPEPAARERHAREAEEEDQILAPLAILEGRRLVAHVDLPFAILALAILIGELVPIKLGDGEGELVLSTTFTFALVLFGGVAAAALTQLVASTVADGVHGKRLVHWAFNIGQYSLAIAASGVVFALGRGGLSGEKPLEGRDRPPASLPPLGCFRASSESHLQARSRRPADLGEASHRGDRRGSA
jgi:hypothetical protein